MSEPKPETRDEAVWAVKRAIETVVKTDRYVSLSDAELVLLAAREKP